MTRPDRNDARALWLLSLLISGLVVVMVLR